MLPLARIVDNFGSGARLITCSGAALLWNSAVSVNKKRFHVPLGDTAVSWR